MNLKDQKLLDQLSIAHLTQQQPNTERKIQPGKQLKENNVIVRRFNDLEGRRMQLQQTVAQGHDKTAALLNRVLSSASQLISFIQDEKEDFEKRNESIEQIDSSQYFSKETLVPAMQKVLKSRVAEVSKNHRKAAIRSHMETQGSSDGGPYVNESSSRYLHPRWKTSAAHSHQNLQHPLLQQQSELGLHNQSSQFTNANQEVEDDDLNNDCNVADEEEEALGALKARQAAQTQRLKDNQTRVLRKVCHVESQLLDVTSLVGQLQLEV